MDSLKKRSRRSSRQMFEETVVTVFNLMKKMDTICPGNSTSTKTRNNGNNYSKAYHRLLKNYGEEKILRPSNPSSSWKDMVYNVKRIAVGMIPDFSWAKMQVRLQPPEYMVQLYNGIDKTTKNELLIRMQNEWTST